MPRKSFVVTYQGKGGERVTYHVKADSRGDAVRETRDRAHSHFFKGGKLIPFQAVSVESE